METLVLSHHSVTLYYALFSISNAATLRKRLVTASSLPDDEHGRKEREAVDFAFIDAAMLTSRLHLLTAVNQALLARHNEMTSTHTIHSEILYCLEPGSNISDSLKHFGLSPSTQYLCLLHVAPLKFDSLSAINDEGKQVIERMKELVDGEMRSIDELGSLPDGTTNEKALRKLYKLNQDPVITQTAKDPVMSRQALDELCTSAVALKIVT